MPDQESHRTCKKCNHRRPIDQFPPYTVRSNGHEYRYRSHSCRLCRNTQTRARRLADIERHRISENAQYAKNRARILQQRARRYPKCKDEWNRKRKMRRRANLERFHVVESACRARNREAISARQVVYAKANRDKINAKERRYNARRKATDPAYRLMLRLRSRLNSIHHRLGDSTKSHIHSRELLGCTLEEYRLHLEAQFKPGMGWQNLGAGPGSWQIDHIVALGLFDLTDPEQQRLAFHYTNCQPLWHDEHVAKTANDLRLIQAKRQS